MSVAALVSGASMLALAFAGSSPVLLMTLGVLIGASVPPLMQVVRALYPKMVVGEGVRALFALDTTAQELIWVVGPVGATFLASVVSTAAPLVLSAAVTVLGTAWFLLSARRLHPGVAAGRDYLLGPIAAVVIGGASLTGGLASPLSTFAAALFLTGLNQMMETMGLPTALQFVVFGLVIIGGMLISGDRIIKTVERLLRRRSLPAQKVSTAIE